MPDFLNRKGVSTETRVQPATRAIKLHHGHNQDLADTVVTACPGATLFTLADGVSIYRQGDACWHAYALIDGLVMLSRITPDGQRLALSLLSRGDWLGSLTGASVSREAEEAAEASGPVRLCRVTHADLRIWLSRHPDQAWDLIERMDPQRQRLVNKLESLVTRDVRARLAETSARGGSTPQVLRSTHHRFPPGFKRSFSTRLLNHNPRNHGATPWRAASGCVVLDCFRYNFPISWRIMLKVTAYQR